MLRRPPRGRRVRRLRPRGRRSGGRRTDWRGSFETAWVVRAGGRCEDRPDRVRFVRSVDIVVVGGGIGGSGCATVLARAGLAVLVLEPTTEYPDIVRGEWLAPWGCEDAKATGLYDVLAGAGGHTVAQAHRLRRARRSRRRDGRAPMPLGMFVPGIDGPLCVRHPVACQALADAAVAAGATVAARGRRASRFVDGAVSYVHARRQQYEAGASLVIGADGRALAAAHRARHRAREGADRALPRRRPRRRPRLAGRHAGGGDRGRASTCCASRRAGAGRGCTSRIRSETATRYAGRERAQGDPRRVRDGLLARLGCVPRASRDRPRALLRSADTWTDVRSRRVSSSSATRRATTIRSSGRDCRSRHATRGWSRRRSSSSDDWAPEAFEPYAAERLERMRRLRRSAQVYAVAVGAQGAAGRDREDRARVREDPTAMLMLAAPMMGPHRVPDDAYSRGDDHAVARRRAGATRSRPDP